MKNFDYGESATELRNRIRALWDEKLDTVEISKALQLPQEEIERQLHIALNRRRAVVGSLGKACDATP